MKTILLFMCLFSFNAIAMEQNNSSRFLFVDGTLSITVAAAPAPGLPAPLIVVMRNFTTVYQQNVNWGDTWNIVLPSGTYRIHPLPVSDGTDLYIANTVTIPVPPNGTANTTITYHII